MALSEGNIDRGLRGSSGGVDGAGRAWSGGEHHRAAQGGVLGGIRSLAAARPVGTALRLFWADGVYFSPRLDHDKQCVLGFWKALREVYGEAREQRCWVHKTINVLNQMPKSLQARAKGHLQDIWMAETKADAEAAFDFFVQAYGAKYDKAVERLIKDRDRLLAFYNFPAEHWKHIRTTNPIESTCATVRLRTVKTKGCLNRKTALAMTFKLILSAKRKWRKLNGSDQLADIIDGVPFKDGIKKIVRAT